jgi:hypothetical protein
MLALVILGVGCQADAGGLNGSWTLLGEDDEVVGLMEAGSGGGCGSASARIGLWGPTWGTPGLVSAEIVAESPTVHWAWFALDTGVGEAEAALRLEGSVATLPLGARRGEHEVHLRVRDGAPMESDWRAAADASAAALAIERAAWAAGDFRLHDGAQLVGEVQLRGEDLPPFVAVYDATWLTPGPVLARRIDEGGDLLLSFPVEPSLGGEQALLRLNVATRSAVVPASAHPDQMDRVLTLIPGVVSPEERSAATEAAREAARAAERAFVHELLPRLAQTARLGPGRCAAPAEVEPSWPLLLAGYRVRVLPVGDGCVVELEPERPQHGREFRGVVGPEGVRTTVEPSP